METKYSRCPRPSASFFRMSPARVAGLCEEHLPEFLSGFPFPEKVEDMSEAEMMIMEAEVFAAEVHSL